MNEEHRGTLHFIPCLRVRQTGMNCRMLMFIVFVANHQSQRLKSRLEGAVRRESPPARTDEARRSVRAGGSAQRAPVAHSAFQPRLQSLAHLTLSLVRLYRIDFIEYSICERNDT
jgi:hypothetical protein